MVRVIDLLMRYISVFLLLLTSACSTYYYQPVVDKDAAYVSFANLSREVPEILVITNCKRSQIVPEYIKFRRPGEHTDFLIKIPSNQPVSFVYSYAWFEGENVQLVTKGNRYYQRTEKNTSKGVNSCTEKVTFIPEQNRKYEVYFGKSPQSCVIGVSEVYFDPTKQKKHLMKVKSVAPTEC